MSAMQIVRWKNSPELVELKMDEKMKKIQQSLTLKYFLYTLFFFMLVTIIITVCSSMTLLGFEAF